MSVPTERYIPSQTKRFEVSADPFSRARIDAVAKTTRELQNAQPFFVGVSLWGSLSKGKELNPELLSSTDIELVAFYDAEKFQESGLGNNYDIAGRISTGVKSGISSHLESLNDKPEINLAVRGLAFEGEYSMLARVRDALTGNYGDERELNRLTGVISAFFGLEIGGGLKPYRVDFFKQVSRIMTPDKADRLWRAVSENFIKVVERGEHGTIRTYNIPPALERFYPGSFDEAAKFYGAKKID